MSPGARSGIENERTFRKKRHEREVPKPPAIVAVSGMVD
jgi:hypothetical protein